MAFRISISYESFMYAVSSYLTHVTHVIIVVHRNTVTVNPIHTNWHSLQLKYIHHYHRHESEGAWCSRGGGDDVMSPCTYNHAQTTSVCTRWSRRGGLKGWCQRIRDGMCHFTVSLGSLWSVFGCNLMFVTLTITHEHHYLITWQSRPESQQTLKTKIRNPSCRFRWK